MCAPLVLDLGPTKTHAARTATWTRDPDPASLADGRLRIDTVPAKGRRVESEEYDVAEQQQRVPGARVFQCLKVSDGQVRETVLWDRGDVECGCEAGRFRLACKHSAALKAVVAAGGFDRPAVVRVILPVVACLICGEVMGREDGEVHAACERYAAAEYDRRFAEFDRRWPAKCPF